MELELSGGCYRGAMFNTAQPTRGTTQIINREQGSADALAPVYKCVLGLSRSESPNQRLRRNKRGFVAVLLLRSEDME